MKSAIFLMLLSAPSYANSGMQLDLWVYSSAGGHGLGPETYLAEFRLPAQTSLDCSKIGQQALLYFRSAPLPDGGMSLASYSCEPAP